ncbi:MULTISPECIES: ABC transporter permease [Salinibaculum]|uniref:ABC transporter permease n=1 Tax=Salinibaculum TaxID=2732368 RepID=UPI0030CB3C64
MSGHRTLTALAMGVREYRRMPVLLALMVALPAYIIVVFAALVPDTTVPLAVPGEGTQMASMVEVYVAMFTPMVAGLVGAIAGLFLMRATREADSRLIIAGYRPREVLVARTGLLAVVGVFVTAVAVGATFVTPLSVAHFGWFVVATLLGALVYGLFGVLAGLVFDRLAGVYVVLFGSMIDMFVFQNPMVADEAAVAPYLPGHVPLELAIDAGFGTVELGSVALGVAYLAVLGVVSLGAFYRSARPE